MKMRKIAILALFLAGCTPVVKPVVTPEVLQAITPIPFYCVCGEVFTTECVEFCKTLDENPCYDVGSLEAKEACE